LPVRWDGFFPRQLPDTRYKSLEEVAEVLNRRGELVTLPNGRTVVALWPEEEYADRLAEYREVEKQITDAGNEAIKADEARLAAEITSTTTKATTLTEEVAALIEAASAAKVDAATYRPKLADFLARLEALEASVEGGSYTQRIRGEVRRVDVPGLLGRLEEHGARKEAGGYAVASEMFRSTPLLMERYLTRFNDW